MAVGESVSNGTLWDTWRPPRGNIALPSKGALLGGPYIPPYSWDQNGEHGFNFRAKESSAFWASDKGFCSESLYGAAGQNPVEQRGGESPLNGEEHLFSSS
jgi:hypothetical protein